MSLRPGTKGSKMEFPEDLFASLRRGDADNATAAFRAASIDSLGKPSPTSKKLMETGEWDAKDLLSLVFVDAKVCTGCVGTDGTRFCGKPKNYCNVAAHPKNTVDTVKSGWYILLGKTLGVLIKPSLPPQEAGGPIDAAIASRLTGLKPFWLTRGQWKFVIDAWHGLRVEVLSHSSTEEITFEFNKKAKITNQGETPLSVFAMGNLKPPPITTETPQPTISIPKGSQRSEDESGAQMKLLRQMVVWEQMAHNFAGSPRIIVMLLRI